MLQNTPATGSILRKPLQPHLRASCLAAVLAISLLAPSCADESADESEQAATDTYTVRGEVRQPPSDEDGGTLMVQHEPIHDFVQDGKVVGMDSMTMPFPLAEDVSADHLETGDKVRFTFEMRQDGPGSLQVTALEQLPDDKQLEFGEADPPEQTGEAASDGQSQPPAGSGSQ